MVDAVEGGEGGATPRTGDLALRIVRAVAEGYASDLGELASAVGDDAEVPARHRALLQALNDLESDISRLRRAGHSAGTAWFAGSTNETADGVARILDAALSRLRSLREQAERRADEHRAVEQQRRATVLQLVLGTVAAVLLGPSLVAAVLAALPGWQPVDHRGATFAGLSLMSGGLLWMLTYGLPALVLRRFGRAERLAVTFGILALAADGWIAWPLRSGLDDDAPQITVSCPPPTVHVGKRVVAVIAASAADSELVSDPSGVAVLDSGSVGVKHRTFRAQDAFGHAASSACTYQVVAARHVDAAAPRIKTG